MEKDFLLTESIQERDIDILLLEELNVNEFFCEFFLKNLELPELNKNNIAWKSVSDFGIGETDILFSYKNEQAKIFVLIENKLDADFQTNQFKRYKERAEKYIKNKKCDKAYIVLVAPNEYCINQNQFQNYITYESINNFFEKSKSLRSKFKAHLFNIGIEKLRRGYTAVNDKRVFNFWHKYNNILKLKTSKLFINPDALKVVPSNADWIYFRNKKISELKIKIIHKLKLGYIDIQINNLDVLESIQDFKNYILVNTGKSKSIRCHTHRLDRFEDFKKQIKQVEKSIDELLNIYNFFIKNFE